MIPKWLLLILQACMVEAEMFGSCHLAHMITLSVTVTPNLEEQDD